MFTDVYTYLLSINVTYLLSIQEKTKKTIKFQVEILLQDLFNKIYICIFKIFQPFICGVT